MVLKDLMERPEPRRVPSNGLMITEEENLLNFCKQMIKKRVFQGSYQERRYVEHLKGYRDLVVLHSKENDLKIDLRYIKNRVYNFYNNDNHWVGISLPETIGAPAGLCIWTEIDNLAFGEYWFQIRSIRFKTNEVIIKLKALHPITANTSGSAHEENSDTTLSPQNLYILFRAWKRSISESIMWFLSKEINKDNILALLRFTGVLLLSLMTGSLEMIKFLGVFVIRFLAEMRNLLRVASPIILKIIDLLNKIIGGLFILLAMVWKDIVSSIKGKEYQKKLPRNTSYQPILENYYTTKPNNKNRL